RRRRRQAKDGAAGYPDHRFPPRLLPGLLITPPVWATQTGPNSLNRQPVRPGHRVAQCFMPNSAPPKAIPCRSRHFQVKPQFTHPRGYALFTAVLLGPNNTVFVLVTYMTGLFFLLGPYATMLVYQSEAYPTECRATGGAFAFAMSQPGAILGGLFLTIATAAGLNYTMAALVVGSGACLISGIIMISARTHRKSPSMVASGSPEEEEKDLLTAPVK